MHGEKAEMKKRESVRDGEDRGMGDEKAERSVRDR